MAMGIRGCRLRVPPAVVPAFSTRRHKKEKGNLDVRPDHSIPLILNLALISSTFPQNTASRRRTSDAGNNFAYFTGPIGPCRRERRTEAPQ